MRIAVHTREVLCSLLVAGFTSISMAATAPAPERIYVGHIITMDSALPEAQAVAVSGERIVAVGTAESVLKLRRRGTEVVELGDRVMLPGFIDAHGHLTATAVMNQYVNLAAPPVGTVRSIPELQEALRQFIKSRPLPPGQWIIGVGYDDSQLQEHRHPTREELDAVAADRPVFVVHVSGHMGAANSALLALRHIDATSADPPGGAIRRRAGSREPDGVLEESAYQAVLADVPKPDADAALAGVANALHYYASMGITTVQDGASMRDTLALLREAAKRKMLDLDVVAYRFWSPVGAAFPDDLPYGQYQDRLKIDGVKLILDGSPQGKTAYLSEPYLVPPAGQPASYRGYPSMPAGAVGKALHEALQHGVALLAHANGDAAAQMLIDETEKARRDTGNATGRIVMIHAQTVRDDQLDRMVALNITPSFFVGHTFYWGDWHREQTLGEPRADRISPARSALDRHMPFTLHTDTPVVPPFMLRTIWSAATRRTRSNDILGPLQRIPVLAALQALTINAAQQYGELDSKGSISQGKLADLVILSEDPLRVDPEKIPEIQVLQTISHGRTVFEKKQ